MASKSKKRTALSFRKLFPDLFFIFSDILCDHRCRLFYNYSFSPLFPLMQAQTDKRKKQYSTQKQSFFFIDIPQIILLVYYIKAVSDCLYAISTTHFPGQQYLFSRIRDDKSDFPEFSLHHFLKPLCFHSIRNRGIGIIKMCQQHCLWFKPL